MKAAAAGIVTERLYSKKPNALRGRGHNLVEKPHNTELNQIMSLVHGTPTASLTNVGGIRLQSTTPTPPSITESSNNDSEDDLRLLSAPNSVAQEFRSEVMVSKGGTESLRESVDSTTTNNSLLYRMDTGVNGISQHDTIEALQSQVLMLQETLHAERANKSSKQPQKLVSGAQFRITGKGANTACEDCAITNSNLKKSRETIRSLKVQLARMEDKYVGLRKSKNMADGPISPPVLDVESLQRQIEAMEMKNAQLNKNAHTDAITIEGLQKTLLEWQLKDEVARERAQNLEETNGSLKGANDSLTNQADKWREELGTCRVELEAAQLQLEALKNQADGTSSEKDAEIARLKAQMVDLEDNLQSTRLERTRAQEERDTAQSALTQSEVERHAAMVKLDVTEGERDAALTGKAAAEAVVDDLKEQLAVSKTENSRLNADLMDTKGKVVELANENVEIMSELTRLRGLLSDMEGRGVELTKMIEKSMASSVRLCVVAPTVNVQVSGKTLKLKGGLEEGKLKAFLGEQVLSKYSFLYEQQTEGVSPDGQPLSEWLQRLLGDMQATIERHINNAMDSQQ